MVWIGKQKYILYTTLPTQSRFFWVGLSLGCTIGLLGKEVATEGVTDRCFEDSPHMPEALLVYILEASFSPNH